MIKSNSQNTSMKFSQLEEHLKLSIGKPKQDSKKSMIAIRAFIRLQENLVVFNTIMKISMDRISLEN